jgi:hypothetical protein
VFTVPHSEVKCWTRKNGFSSQIYAIFERKIHSCETNC